MVADIPALQITATTQVRQRAISISTSRVGLHLAACFIGFVMAFPLLWMLMTALKAPADIFSDSFLPSNPTLDNFRVAFETKPVWTWLKNSLLTSASITLLRVVLAVMAAYVIGHMKLRLSGMMTAMLLGTMLIPGVVTLIPNYLTIANLGWLNSTVGVVIPQVASSAFFVFLLRQFVKQIPQDLFDSAELDGAGHFVKLRDIVVPLIMPGILAAAALSFLWGWNSYLWPLLVLPATDSQTIAIGLGTFASDPDGPQLWGPLMATALISSIPPLAIFVVAQKHLATALTSGMKG